MIGFISRANVPALQIEYDFQFYVSSIEIYETWTPGGVVEIQARDDATGEYFTIWQVQI